MVIKYKSNYYLENKYLINVLTQLNKLKIKSIRSLSEMIGFSYTYVLSVLTGKKPISDSFLFRLNSLGIYVFF